MILFLEHLSINVFLNVQDVKTTITLHLVFVYFVKIIFPNVYFVINAFNVLYVKLDTLLILPRHVRHATFNFQTALPVTKHISAFHASLQHFFLTKLVIFVLSFMQTV